jgi:hypothetical protein
MIATYHSFSMHRYFIHAATVCFYKTTDEEYKKIFIDG